MHNTTTKILPGNYILHKTLDLSNRKSMIMLNMIAIVFIFPTIYLFDNLVKKLRPELSNGSLLLKKLTLINIASIIIIVLITILIHELIHGLFFWIFTKEKPRFAFKVLYAYAAAPEWYIPKGNFIIIGLSPVILISISVILLLNFLSPNLIKFLAIAGIFNFIGSIGDLIVITWVLLQPNDGLINDSGDSFKVYVEKEKMETV